MVTQLEITKTNEEQEIAEEQIRDRRKPVDYNTIEYPIEVLVQKYLDGIDEVKNIDAELDKTLKATGFLLLYNLVESTIRNAIEAIFDDLVNQNVSFDDLREEVKKIVINNF